MRIILVLSLVILSVSALDMARHGGDDDDAFLDETLFSLDDDDSLLSENEEFHAHPKNLKLYWCDKGPHSWGIVTGEHLRSDMFLWCGMKFDASKKSSTRMEFALGEAIDPSVNCHLEGANAPPNGWPTGKFINKCPPKASSSSSSSSGSTVGAVTNILQKSGGSKIKLKKAYCKNGFVHWEGSGFPSRPRFFCGEKATCTVFGGSGNNIKTRCPVSCKCGFTSGFVGDKQGNKSNKVHITHSDGSVGF